MCLQTDSCDFPTFRTDDFLLLFKELGGFEKLSPLSVECFKQATFHFLFLTPIRPFTLTFPELPDHQVSSEAVYFPQNVSIFTRYLQTANSPVDLNDDTSCGFFFSKIYEAAGKPLCYVTEHKQEGANYHPSAATVGKKNLLHFHTLDQGIGSLPVLFGFLEIDISTL